MKKNRIFLATGALALTISAVFATKASKKFAPGIRTAEVSINGTELKFSQSSSDLFTVHAASGLNQVYAVFTYTKVINGTPHHESLGSGYLVTTGGSNNVYAAPTSF